MTYRLRVHPDASEDLMAIARWIAEYSGSEVAVRKIDEIENAMLALALTPQKGTLRHEIAPGLRAIPAGRNAVIAFTVDDDNRQVLVYAISYGGANWIGQVARRK